MLQYKRREIGLSNTRSLDALSELKRETWLILASRSRGPKGALLFTVAFLTLHHRRWVEHRSQEQRLDRMVTVLNEWSTGIGMLRCVVDFLHSNLMLLTTFLFP